MAAQACAANPSDSPRMRFMRGFFIPPCKRPSETLPAIRRFMPSGFSLGVAFYLNQPQHAATPPSDQVGRRSTARDFSIRIGCLRLPTEAISPVSMLGCNYAESNCFFGRDCRRHVVLCPRGSSLQRQRRTRLRTWRAPPHAFRVFRSKRI